MSNDVFIKNLILLNKKGKTKRINLCDYMEFHGLADTYLANFS